MDKVQILRRSALGVFIMLVVQFILGMTLNLFITLPKTFPGDTGTFWNRILHGLIWALTNGGGLVLSAHVIVALGIIVGAITLVARSILFRSKKWLIVSSIGGLGALGALFNGLSFISYGHDINSYIMAWGYAIATTCYTIGLFGGETKSEKS